MKKINKRDIIIFSIISLISIVIFLPFLMGHYATDTYNIYNIGYEEYAINWSLKAGRVFMCLIGLLANKININIDVFVFITLFVSIIISNVVIMILRSVIKKYKEPKSIIQDILLTAICYISIYSFMYLENMYFVESIVMSLSILLYIIAANILVNKNKLYIVKSAILVILGITCYQGTIGMFFMFALIFSILKNKESIKQIIIDIIKVLIIAFIAIMFNFVTLKIIENSLHFEQSRVGSISNIFKNIGIIITRLPELMIENCNLFPKYLFMLFLIVTTLIVVIYAYKNKKDNKFLIKYVLIIITAFIGSNILFLSTTSSFYTGRLRNPTGALLGIIYIYLFVESSLLENKNSLNTLAIANLIAYIIMTYINYEYIMFMHKEINNIENMQVKEIESYIDEYENKSGIKVTKIIKVPYRKQIENNDIERNALETYWAADGVINYYTNKNLITNKYEKTDKKYNNIQEEYKCIDDTLYIKVYYY